MGEYVGKEQHHVGIRVPSDWMIESDFMDSYRKGDPLRAIARATERDLEEVCLLIMAESSPSDELERSRAVRRRASATNEVLLANEEMVERLHASEIDRDEIPKVLKALGISIDIPTAAELLHIPGIPGGQTVEDTPTRRIGDKLSLLYVAGVHHRIEPDYQLALGKDVPHRCVGAPGHSEFTIAISAHGRDSSRHRNDSSCHPS